MKRIVAIVGLLGIAGGCTTTPASPFGTTYAPAYTPGPAYPAAPVYQPQACTCAPAAVAPATTTYRAAAPYVVPASYQQTCAPCCN